MIEDLKKNLEQAKHMIGEIDVLTLQMNSVAPSEKNMYASSITALKRQLKMLNDAIPLLLQNIAFETAVQTNTPQEITRIQYTSPTTNERQMLVIKESDKEKYAKELKISTSSINELKNLNQNKKNNNSRPNFIVKISNVFFRGISEKLALNMSDLGKDLREANISLTQATYISISLFVSMMLLLLSTAAIGVLYYLDPANLKWIWILALPLVSLTIFYIFPSTQKSAVKKGISNELPFVTIYMSAIANSNVESTQIFKIISKNPEYPYIAREMKKIINQIEIYGLDLVTSLRNAAKKTTNPRLSELFNGLATNIISGGSLKNYLEKKSENFLIDYKLDRQRYSALAETFMDMYISILVAAPLILVLLLIVMSSTNMALGLPFSTLTMLTLGGVVLINIIFMIVVHVKQPTS